jgi:hypothetical protein
MSTATDATNGGRAPGETTSDYNMYFTMAGGTNRGFVFRNNNAATGAVAGIDSTGTGYFNQLRFGGHSNSVAYDFDGAGTVNSGDSLAYLKMASGIATGTDFDTYSIEPNWTALAGSSHTDCKFRIISARGNDLDALKVATGTTPNGTGDTTIIGNVVGGTNPYIIGGVSISATSVRLIGTTLAADMEITDATITNASSNNFQSSSNTAYFLSPSATGTSLNVAGSIELNGAIREKILSPTSTSVSLDPGNGSIHTQTLSGNTTYTFSGDWNAGESLTLMIDDGSAYTVTWPTMTWVNNGGAAPTLATTGYTTVVIWKISTVFYGAVVGTGA